MAELPKRRVAIVGAGLVGSLWAVLLRQQGYAVDIFEKRADIRKSTAAQGRSINLVVTSRGLHGLERAGLLEQALEFTVPVFGRMIHSKTGQMTYQAYGTEKECNYSVSRLTLNKFLLTAAERIGAQFHFDCELSDINFENKILHFNNGSRDKYHYDLLFGTDGAGSLVRKFLTQKFPEIIRDSIDWLEADYKELHLPGTPLVQKDALHIWPRGSHMLMGLANPDGSFTMTLYLPKNGPVSFETIQSPDAIKNLFETEFADTIPLMPDYQEQFLKSPQGALGTVRCSSWVFGDSVALMGDAAHAMVPFFGQGMNCGFEDCTAFLEILKSDMTDWTDVLKKYEKSRIPNANAISEMAIENWTEMRDKVGDPAFLLRKKVEAWLEAQFPKQYKSRYGLITYTTVPYANAQSAGKTNDKILDQLCIGITSPEQLTRESVEKLFVSK